VAPPHESPPPLGAAHGPPAYAPPAYGSAAYGPSGYGWAPLPHGSQGGAPAGPSVVWAVLLWVLAALSLIGALAFSGIATAGFFSNSYLDSYGVTTTATVTNVQVFTDTVTVEFTTDDGTPARAEIVWFAAGNVPAVGDEVEITYDPDDPWHATEAGSDSDAIMGAILVAAAVFSLAVVVGASVGAILVHRRRGKAKRQSATWSGLAQ
jgi:hypothetical protein